MFQPVVSIKVLHPHRAGVFIPELKHVADLNPMGNRESGFPALLRSNSALRSLGLQTQRPAIPY